MKFLKIKSNVASERYVLYFVKKRKIKFFVSKTFISLKIYKKKILILKNNVYFFKEEI